MNFGNEINFGEIMVLHSVFAVYAVFLFKIFDRFYRTTVFVCNFAFAHILLDEVGKQNLRRQNIL